MSIETRFCAIYHKLAKTPEVDIEVDARQGNHSLIRSAPVSVEPPASTARYITQRVHTQTHYCTLNSELNTSSLHYAEEPNIDSPPYTMSICTLTTIHYTEG